MAKRLDLSAAILAAPVPPPQAALSVAKTASLPKERRVPLQIRIPPTELKAIKRAALDADSATVSDFMLACFHAYMNSRKQ